MVQGLGYNIFAFQPDQLLLDGLALILKRQKPVWCTLCDRIMSNNEFSLTVTHRFLQCHSNEPLQHEPA